MTRPNQKHERVLIDERPHIAFVFTQMWPTIFIGLVAWGGSRWVGMLTGQPILIMVSWVPIAIIAIRFVLGLVDWLSRRHVLTETRIIAQRGVIRRVRVEIPLHRVQHTILVVPVGERLMGLGSIGITSAGTGGVDLVWRGVEHAQQVLDTIKSQVERMSTHGLGKQVTPVIGIVGGIGSGKSTVARVFESLGCVISDSDASVREILTNPSVMRVLADWWGEDIFAADGTIDRSRVAQIVFGSAMERRKLEGLIHPLVHERRREEVLQAREKGASGVIIDAPLLFEAGVDSECDAIVFVDVPLEIRLERVKSTRGWDAQELDRREKAQMGLEQKRNRSDYVLSNTGLPDELHGRVARVLASIQRDLRDRQPSD